MSFSLAVSLTLAIVAVILFVIAAPQKIRNTLRLVFLSGFFLFLLFTIAHLGADYFTNRGIDESVLFHLVYGFKGAGFSEYSTLILIATVAFLTAVLLVLGTSKAGQKGIRGPWLIYPALVLLLCSLTLHPVAKLIYPQSTTMTFAEKFEDYYREPTLSEKKIGDRKNLVFVYVEGLERTWLDQELFPGLTPNLQDLRGSAIDFRNIKQMPFTGWTIAGMVASQCGLPLVVASHGNGMSGMDSFLPGAVCMGDLLRLTGYHLEFFGGANLEFAGKGNFFKSHGFASVNGREELAEFVKPGYMTGWGLYDDTLLELNFQRFMALAESETPFAMVMLTLDTHHPKGMPSQSCRELNSAAKGNATSMHFAIGCSDYLISKFIRDIRKSPYSEETLIVLVSDHLAMKNAASTILDKVERKILFMIMPGWDQTQAYVDTPGSIFDVGATTLGFLGVEVSIGFGRDLMRERTVFDNSQRTESLFKSWSSYFANFWEFPNLENGLVFDPTKGILSIADAKIKIPVLILFDANLDTKLVFDDFADVSTEILDATYRSLKRGAPFAYVADCVKFSEATQWQRGEEKCLLFGSKGSEDNKLIYLHDSPRISKKNFVTVIRPRK